MRTFQIRDIVPKAFLVFLFMSSLLLVSNAGEKDVIINELYYHPSSDFESEEYIELYNHGTTPVDLSGWYFSKGISYTFPEGSLLEADAYLMVVHDKSIYSSPSFSNVYGNYEGRLSNNGEKITLKNRMGNSIDSVRYYDTPPWPTRPDGDGSSLERICPSVPSDETSNWASAVSDNNQSWQFVQIRGNFRSETMYFTLIQSGIVWIDQVSLVLDGETQNLIQNGDFESDGEWIARGNHQNTQRLQTNAAKSGSYVLQIESASLNTESRTNSISLTISPSIPEETKGTLSFWLCPLDVQGEMMVQTRRMELMQRFQIEKSDYKSPGWQNTVFSEALPPIITDVTWTPACPAPDQPVTIETRLRSQTAIRSARVVYKIRTVSSESKEMNSSLQLVNGTTQDGIWQCHLNGQINKTLVRFTISATDISGFKRTSPPATEARNTYTYFHYNDNERSLIPVAYLYQFGVDDPEGLRGESAMVIRPPEDSGWQVYDHIITYSRKSGYNVKFLKKYEYHNMSSLNIIFDPKPRYLLAEYMSYAVHRSIGVIASDAGHFRLFRNNSPYGYYLYFEQPNKNFMARNGLDNDGNNYKIIYGWDRSPTEENIIRQHEKKTNLSTGYEDVVSMIQNLHSLSGEAQTAFIRANLNVDEIINYFVGTQLTSDWDGYFNNHFVYHDIYGTGQWYIFPWDKDKTWGDHDGYREILPYYTFYDMPILFGAFGTPRSGLQNNVWWREPGFISGPFLANKTIQDQYLYRLGYVAQNLFTLEKWGPVIDALEKRLEPEVQYRAKILGRDENNVLNEFHTDIESFRRQVVTRRAFILSEVEKRIGPVSIADWSLY